jgi:hypothetical protein
MTLYQSLLATFANTGQQVPGRKAATQPPYQQGDMLLFGEPMRHFNPSLQCLLYLDDTGNKQVGFLENKPFQTLEEIFGRFKQDQPGSLEWSTWFHGAPQHDVTHRRCDADIGLQTR